jgi:hypothetical protein
MAGKESLRAQGFWDEANDRPLRRSTAMTQDPLVERFIHLADNYAVAEGDLCMHFPPSPDSDYRCIAVKGHRGAHQYCWSPDSSLRGERDGVHYARASVNGAVK